MRVAVAFHRDRIPFPASKVQPHRAIHIRTQPVYAPLRITRFHLRLRMMVAVAVADLEHRERRRDASRKAGVDEVPLP